MWYKSKVFAGEKVGRTIQFPTANLETTAIPSATKQGVYASWVSYENTLYKGALYFGPRLVFNETKVVLEIFLINFSGDLYQKVLQFTLEEWLRPPLSFSNLDELKQQLKADVSEVNRYLTNTA